MKVAWKIRSHSQNAPLKVPPPAPHILGHNTVLAPRSRSVWNKLLPVTGPG